MINVNVKANHIADGRPGHPCRCPVALALSDLVNNEHIVAVTQGLIIVSQKRYDRLDGLADAYVQSTPVHVLDFIWHYDQGIEVDPIEFDIDIPKRLLKDDTDET